jgi:TonB family protein
VEGRVMRLMRLALLFIAILTVTASAQTPTASTPEKPNVSGTWSVPPRTDLSLEGAVRERVLDGTLCGERCEITQDGSTLRVTRHLPNGSPDVLAYLPGEVWTFVVDGGVEHQTSSSADVATEARWVSGTIVIKIAVVKTLPGGGARMLETKSVFSRTAARMTAETTQTDTAGILGPKPATPEAVVARTFYLEIAASTSAPPDMSGGFPGSGCTNPTMVRSVDPKYTHEATLAKIEGNVEIEAVIQKDGTVGHMRVSQSLDTQFGLDDEAMRAAKGWLFRPAICQGQPVDMIATLQLQFKR